MRCLVLWVALALSGCASLPSPFSRHLDPRAEHEVRQCAQLFKNVDAAVAKAGVRDGGEVRVKGYPYLRTTRFLASLKDKLTTQSETDQWIALLRQTDLKARRYEVLNLSELGGSRDVLKRLDQCGERLAKIDASDDAQGDNLKGAVFVPPDYQTWKRVLGVYALTRIPFASGVRGYQRETEEIFRTPVERLKIRGKLVRYGSVPQAARSEEDSAESPGHPLGLPQRSPRDLSRLFERHAPIFEVDEAGDFDRLGALTWAANNRLSVDPNAPTAYRRAAYTRYQDRVLLQLVYAVWFPARPKTSAFDLLGGQLDGVMWRVTLDEQDRPLLFDSIHPCGCYHQFFPTPRLRLKPKPDTLEEYAFVPQRLPSIETGQRVVIRVASRTHYLERISMVTDHPAIDKTYAFADDDDLRSLPMGEKRRSVFRPDGIVSGSERGERFFFWPMGVRNAGAMRQYGRHATAFVGKRHFDDEDLIDRYFVLGGD